MVCMAPAVFGLLAVAYQPELSGYSVPMLLLVKTGVGKTVLTPLIKTGYSYIGYATLIVIVIPFIVHMIVGCVKKQPVMGSEAAEN